MKSGKFKLNRHQNIIFDIFKEMENRNICLEINSNGLRKHMKEQHPEDKIIDWVRNFQISLIFGSDAHSPEQIAYGWDDLIKKNIWFKRIKLFLKNTFFHT